MTLICCQTCHLAAPCSKARDDVWCVFHHLPDSVVHKDTAVITFSCKPKNAPTLESCSLDRHSLFLMIFGKQHQHTFWNDIHIQLSLSLHFCLVYLLVSSCGGNDATTATGSSSSLTHWHCKRRRRSCCNGQWRKRLR